eukprot:CAMPEP_0197700636 /NCGR_PEP_ID=MMETSP1338-20131121/122214_1 /TAXON_ID=43686 ORGANISM="Pelagodinium beii, Strain RCC1491" /NCGR_SAMPLE_ID=MMETSP1338 /ASSEMBLY_ACC=CAM_ASM_000754 /LENGTH=98 /DNA_ID=CAMNT_0043284271 /DNA_START=557 /DNA_END=853 /DNA_ORIENTATION=+
MRSSTLRSSRPSSDESVPERGASGSFGVAFESFGVLKPDEAEDDLESFLSCAASSASISFPLLELPCADCVLILFCATLVTESPAAKLAAGPVLLVDR